MISGRKRQRTAKDAKKDVQAATLFPRDFSFPATSNLLIFPDSSQSVHCYNKRALPENFLMKRCAVVGIALFCCVSIAVAQTQAGAPADGNRETTFSSTLSGGFNF